MDSSIIRIEIAHDTFALVDTRGATLRKLVVDGVDVIRGIDVMLPNKKAAGEVLIPWPNRVRDGKWISSTRCEQLEITEPQRNNAIHGLIRNKVHDISAQTKSRVTLSTTIDNEMGYPYQLDISTDYSVVDEGIVVTHQVENRGEGTAPVGIGAHPYVCIGNIPVDDLALRVPARTRVVVDDRLNPIGYEQVDGTEFDLRTPRRVGDCKLDTAFCDLEFSDGVVVHQLRSEGGSSLDVWAGEEFTHVQVYTTPEFPNGKEAISAIAIEPMTCPPNGLNNLETMAHLARGEQQIARWGIVLSP